MGEPVLIERVEVLARGTEHQRGRSNLELAVAGFLARYRVKHTRDGYACSLRQYLDFCSAHFVDPFAARAAHIELWARKLEDVDGLRLSTVAAKLNALAGFYRYAVAEDYTDRNPMENVLRPQIERVSPREGLTRPEFADLLTAARFSGPRDHALIRLGGINGLRVAEVVGIDIEHIRREQGELLVHILRKGGKTQAIPLSTRTAWAVEQTAGERSHGPLFLSREGSRLDRAGAGRVVKRLVRVAGIDKHITFHSLRHTYATLCRAAGIPDDEIAAGGGWADIRMPSYYDRGSKVSKARNATATLDAFVDRAL